MPTHDEHLKRVLEERAKQDREMMSSPDHWPRWPVLPLKRVRDGQMECAFLWADSRPRVYLSDVISFSNNRRSLSEVEHKDYATLRELIEDGWTVD
jgi:hypothetical protein